MIVVNEDGNLYCNFICFGSVILCVFIYLVEFGIIFFINKNN